MNKREWDRIVWLVVSGPAGLTDSRALLEDAKLLRASVSECEEKGERRKGRKECEMDSVIGGVSSCKINRLSSPSGY